MLTFEVGVQTVCCATAISATGQLGIELSSLHARNRVGQGCLQEGIVSEEGSEVCANA